MKAKCLPSDDEDPYSWLISELHKDKEWIRGLESDYSEEYQSLKDLENELTRERKDEINYEDIMKKRARVLMGVF